MRRKHTCPLHLERLEPRTLLSSYFVAPNGNDSAAGTDQAPWLTLQRAANAVRASDDVTVRAGTYAGFDLRTDGAAANPITFRAEPGVVIDTRNPRTPDGINLEGADYVTLEGFVVVNQPRAGIRSVLNRGVTIRGNVLVSNSRWGVLTGFSDGVLIEFNATLLSQIEHGIYVSNSGDRPVIRGNFVYGNRANGIHMNGDRSLGGDGIISGALVENNYLIENGAGGGSGINCDGVQDSRIQNNLIYGTHASGISLYRIDGGDGSKRNVVVNNTVHVAANGRWALNVRDGSTNNTVYNNILYNDHARNGSITISADSLPGFTSDYNVVMNRFTTNDAASILTLAQWRAATGQDANSRIATPAQLFVDAANGDYHLAANSPARDAGTWMEAPYHDLDWLPRYNGSTWDIGAYEDWLFGGGAPGSFGGAREDRTAVAMDAGAVRFLMEAEASRKPTAAFAELAASRGRQTSEDVTPALESMFSGG